MAVVKKISELVPKGSALGVTDLLVVGVDNGTDYDLKSVTGAQLLGTVVSQTITDGDTTHSPSSNVVFDTLALKVDKVTGSRLITSGEATILDNTSGTNSGDETVTTIKNKLGITTLSGSNTGDQTLQQITSLGSITTDNITVQKFNKQSGLNNSEIYSIDNITGARCSMNSNGSMGLKNVATFEVLFASTNATASYTLEAPIKASGTYTIATTSDLTSKVDSNTAITGATKTKITYDNKGLVTSGTDATTADISDSLNKRYVTDANLTVIGNTSGTNTGDETVTTIKTKLGITTLSGSNTGDQDLSGLMVKSNNLSDLTNTTTARTNLGLGSLATQSGTFSGTSSGTNTGDQIISDATISLTDITTNNFDTTKHGFVPKGTNTGKFLKDDGTWGTPASGSSGGIWGIANSSGVYTYYSTWALAVAAAVSGQVIELFADITENSVGYTLKNGVNVNGNGHTISSNTATATLTDGGVAVTCDVSNIIINKSFGEAYRNTNTLTNVTGNCKIISIDTNYNNATVYGILTGWSIEGNVRYPLSIYSSGIVNDLYIVTADGNNVAISTNSTTCKINNCIIKTSGNGIGGGGGIINNCTVYANGYGISCVTGEVNNCNITCMSSTALILGANTYANNCYGRSAGGRGFSATSSSIIYNSVLISDSNVVGTADAFLSNCILLAKAEACIYLGGGGKFINCTIISNHNNPGGNCFQNITSNTYIVDCFLQVANTVIIPIFSSGTPTLYMSGNSVKGTTNFKSAGVVQGQTNTADAQGNVILN